MYFKKSFPYMVAGFIIAVGLLFSVSSLTSVAFLDPDPPGRHFLLAFSIILIVSGVYSIYMIKRGKLEKSGNSIDEVRHEAIENLKDPALLAQIASEDQNPEIQKTAEVRLEELN
jgi:hypothetical protein